jgi:hypothetical protein
VTDTDFRTDGEYNMPLVQNDVVSSGRCGGSGPYTKVERAFLSGFINFRGLASGNNELQVSLCAITNGSGGGTMNNVPNVGLCP